MSSSNPEENKGIKVPKQGAAPGIAVPNTSKKRQSLDKTDDVSVKKSKQAIAKEPTWYPGFSPAGPQVTFLSNDNRRFNLDEGRLSDAR